MILNYVLKNLVYLSHFKFNISKTESWISSHICSDNSIPNLSKWYYLLRSSEQNIWKNSWYISFSHHPNKVLWTFLSKYIPNLITSHPLYCYHSGPSHHHFLPRKLQKCPNRSLIFYSWPSCKSDFYKAIRPIIRKYTVFSFCDAPGSLAMGP